MNVKELETPALLLDAGVLRRNIARMRERLRALGVPLRPHMKTAKCIEVAQLALEDQPGGITVSSLREAEYFFGHGVSDIVYAVGMVPSKVARAAALIRRGVRLTIILDSIAAARAIADAAGACGVRLPTLIEVDVDAQRAGVDPDGAQLVALGREIARSSAIVLRGVLTHAGGSYQARSVDSIRDVAERERAGAVRAADRLREAGLPVEVVSVGSTPTATFARELTGVTEVRAGVYMFNDVVMATLGVCDVRAIALSVLVSVIGHQPERGWIITDGGWMALSRDPGPSSATGEVHYGIVCDAKGVPAADDLRVVSVSQEHGIIASRSGMPTDPARFPVGTQLRILPNHACATAGQHELYRVVEDENPEVVATWRRITGW